MADTTRQRIGAQTEAARKVHAKQAEFGREIDGVLQAHDDLHTGYLGGAAVHLSNLVNQWAEDAKKLVAEFDGFASRLVQTDRKTAASQEEAGSVYNKAQTTFRTSI